MTRHVVELDMRPPNWRQRLWYWRLHTAAPQAVSSRGPEDWARLVPYCWRAFHQRYATRHGYFWLPCILCNYPFGGHESGDSIPDPTGPTGGGIVICYRCTRDGHGWRIPHPLEAIVDTIRDLYEHGHDQLTPGCADCETIDAETRAAFARYKEPDK